MKSTFAIGLITTGGAGLIYGTFLLLVRLDLISPESLRFTSVLILLWVSLVILIAGVIFLVHKKGGETND